MPVAKVESRDWPKPLYFQQHKLHELSWVVKSEAKAVTLDSRIKTLPRNGLA